MLPNRNAMPQRQDMTRTLPVTVYRHRADLSLCYPLMWNVTLEYTTTHFNVLGHIRSGNPSQTFHTHQRTLKSLMLWCQSEARQKVCRTHCVLNTGPVVCESITLPSRPQLLRIRFLIMSFICAIYLMFSIKS